MHPAPDALTATARGTGRGVDVPDVEVTSDGWHVLRRTTDDRRRSDGTWATEPRETCDRGDGATVLLQWLALRSGPPPAA